MSNQQQFMEEVKQASQVVDSLKTELKIKENELKSYVVLYKDRINEVIKKLFRYQTIYGEKARQDILGKKPEVFQGWCLKKLTLEEHAEETAVRLINGDYKFDFDESIKKVDDESIYLSHTVYSCGEDWDYSIEIKWSWVFSENELNKHIKREEKMYRQKLIQGVERDKKEQEDLEKQKLAELKEKYES